MCPWSQFGLMVVKGGLDLRIKMLLKIGLGERKYLDEKGHWVVGLRLILWIVQ